MLERQGLGFEGLRVSVSGSGNVAQYAVEKAMALGAKVVTVSDSSGTVVDEAGFTPEAGRTDGGEEPPLRPRRDYARSASRRASFEPGVRPWQRAGRRGAALRHAERAGRPRRADAGATASSAWPKAPTCRARWRPSKVFEEARVLYAPGKASNAGGVATSGLEMSQNAMRLAWDRDEVDARLHGIMRSIHEACVRHGSAPMAASATSTAPTWPASSRWPTPCWRRA
jgi:glutamate dehydrogenase (NADP+)